MFFRSVSASLSVIRLCQLYYNADRSGAVPLPPLRLMTAHDVVGPVQNKKLRLALTVMAEIESKLPTDRRGRSMSRLSPRSQVGLLEAAIKELLAEAQQVAAASLDDSVFNLVFTTYYNKLHPPKKNEEETPGALHAAPPVATLAPNVVEAAATAFPVIAPAAALTQAPGVRVRAPKRTAAAALSPGTLAEPGAFRGEPIPRHG